LHERIDIKRIITRDAASATRKMVRDSGLMNFWCCEMNRPLKLSATLNLTCRSIQNGGLSGQAIGEITPGVLLLEIELYKQKLGIVDLLHAGRNSLSKDPPDKVFALLSLENGDSKMEIYPDYSKPVDWLFTHVAVQSIKNSKSLDILSHVRGKTGLHHLPS
jgi:hypothetical protein